MTGDSRITPQSLKMLINKFMPHSNFSSQNDIAYLMSVFDKDQDGSIGPSDFEQAFQGFEFDEAAILSESSPIRRS
jgi:Ca2+-binding EF-hand superfamily protein